jgi:DNA-binding GntR family transcriptional regulator
MAVIEKISHNSLREQIYRSVRKAIMNGRFIPGESVTIMQLAEMVGTSAMPVREALRQLVAEDALEMLPNRSVVVPRLSLEEFDDITSLRCHVEGLVGARAAERVEDKDIKILEDLNAQMADAYERRDVDAYLRCNWNFHFAIYRLGNNRNTFYLSLIERLWIRVGPLIRYCLNEAEFRSAGDLHELAILSLRRRDGAAVRLAIERDIAEAAVYIRSTYQFAEAHAPSRSAAQLNEQCEPDDLTRDQR